MPLLKLEKDEPHTSEESWQQGKDPVQTVEAGDQGGLGMVGGRRARGKIQGQVAWELKSKPRDLRH